MNSLNLRAAVALGIMAASGIALANGDVAPQGNVSQGAQPPAPASLEERAGIKTNRTGDPLLDRLIQGNYPLTLDQQLKMRDYLASEAKGLQQHTPRGNLYGDPVHVIDITQGGPTQEVPLQLGYLTSLMVVGENGASWPIQRVTSGDVSVVKPNIVEGGSTSVELVPQTPWVSTNVHIYMAGRVEPVKLYARVSADPQDGLRDTIKVVIDGVPPGSAPLLQPNRTAVDSHLMNALGQAPGRNWTELRVAGAEQIPFRLTYWMAPNGKEAIVRLRNAQMVGPDWLAETRDPDGDVRVYRYQSPIPLMLRIRDAAGLEHQVRLDNPADLLAGRNTSRTMSLKQVSPARPPIDTALDFEPPAGIVGHDRTQTIHRPSRPADDIQPRYVSFDGKGKRANRVEIVDDLGLNRDTAKRLIEEAHKSRPSAPVAPGSLASAEVKAIPVPVAAPLQTSTFAAQPSAAAADYSFQVQAGGLYENLYRYTAKHRWKAPIWDLGNQDIVIENSYVVSGGSPEEVLAKFLDPYSQAYKFSAKVSRTERAVWIK